MAKAEAIKSDDKWQAEDDARTILRAEEIKQDPERFSKAKVFLSKQKRAIMSIGDIEEERLEHTKEKNKGNSD